MNRDDLFCISARLSVEATDSEAIELKTCDQPSESLFGVDRRKFLSLGAVALMTAAMGDELAAAASGAAGYAFELEEKTIDELQKGMAAGRLSAESITRLYLDRIQAMNLEGPAIREPFVQRGPFVMGSTDELDAIERAFKEGRFG